MSSDTPLLSSQLVWTATIDVAPVEPSLRGTALAGALAVLVGFGGFLTWGFTASLDSAALAAGTVMVESHRKTVSHLEGGILRDLLVKDGDPVRAGQVLLRMDSTQSQAVVAQLQGQYWTALARLGRLRAEQSDAPKPLFTDELVKAVRDNPVAAEAMAVEERLFRSRHDSYEAQLGIQRKQISSCATRSRRWNPSGSPPPTGCATPRRKLAWCRACWRRDTSASRACWSFSATSPIPKGGWGS